MNAQNSGLSSPAESSFSLQVVLFWTLALALPVAALISMELWLETNYTRGLFHRSGFVDLYTTGIFRYRLLGRDLLLKTHALLLHIVPAKSYPMPGDPEADLPFVFAYAVFNGLCFFLTNLLTLALLWNHRRGFRIEALPLYLYVFLLTCLSMAVVTPYDQLAYLLLLFAVVGARCAHPAAAYALVIVSAVLGTLNRETEFLATSLLVTLAVFAPPLARRRRGGLAVAHFVASMAVYIGLRLAFAGSASVASVLTFGGKWALPAAIVDTALLTIALVLAQFLFRSLRPAVLLFVLSLPYLITIFLTGVLRELRLLVPLLICLLLLYDTLRRQSATPVRT